MPSSVYKQERENTCNYCLYFQNYPYSRRPAQGNCAYYKQWIANAALTTCSDMSVRRLKEKGIYQLLTDGHGGWLYVKRQEKIRTRLFAVRPKKTGAAEKGTKPAEP
jgi:hypothetical protein